MIKKVIISLAILISSEFYSQNTLLGIKNTFLSVLKSQLSAGVSGEKSETDYPTYQFTLKDLEATESIISKELEDNGYKKPGKEDFANTVNKVFNRIIDPRSESKYLHINFEDKCSKDFKLFKNSNSIDVNPYSTYVFKNGLFISDLYSIPEILDYTKDHELLQYEKDAENNNHITDVKIYYWKDIADLKNIRKQNIKTIVARNMYLFNNNKSYTTWLVQNDQVFVKNLIKFFGYDKESKFNEILINEYIQSKDQHKIGELIFSKNCNKELEIRDGILQSLTDTYQKSSNPKDLFGLMEFSSKLLETNGYSNYSESEKIKMLAYLANTYDFLFKKNHRNQDGWDPRWNILGAYFEDDSRSKIKWSKLKEEMQRNNYYGLPNLKEVINYAEGFDSVGAPD
ncbi:hypothetical protein WH221_08840 [Chryseobacterium culicis]|uniref:Uncharacterized protein n=1 Tax=Chryseobacterium culicis TaxID=680127 RepID=A0A2S9D0Q3_CHRCI|nr:hypothetical protein [Chryseobacterium culicis]PRB86339.1 hypothetical protein CQ022_08835 [Chryseobacterium culicis]PRB92092.1 hypothetical protein CQ033_02505 [Chryseobacterium culicis]